jgi:hypothetical protein
MGAVILAQAFAEVLQRSEVNTLGRRLVKPQRL